MRVIGTGWRYWATSDRAIETMFTFMDGLLDLVLMTNDPMLQLVLGGGTEKDPYQQGADRWLYKWAESNNEFHGGLVVPMPIVFEADWDNHGNAAGPLRNAQMILAGADLVVAFPHAESRGTVDCLAKAVRARIARMVVPWVPDKDPVDQPEPTLEVINGGLHLPVHQSETYPLGEAA